MKKTYLLYFILIILCACSKREIITYEAPIFSVHTKLDVEIINDDFLFKAVNFIDTYDSLLIVCDPAIEPFVHIFDKRNGAHIASGGNKGKGPGELIHPQKFTFDRNNGQLYIFDAGKRTIVQMSIDSLIAKSKTANREIRFSNEFTTNAVYHLKDSLFILKNGIDNFVLLTENRTIDKITISSPPPFKAENWLYFLATNSITKTNHKGDRMVDASTIGGIMYIYSVNNGRITSDATKYFYEPVFDKKEVVFNFEESIFGFADLYLSDRYIYGILFGEKNPQHLPLSFKAFDYGGNPLTCYNLEYHVEKIAVDKDDDYVYMVVYKDDEQVLAKAILPKL